MIRYLLRCVHAHEFEGWFRSSSGFDRQSASGLVSCPECGSTEVGRALMAPSILAGTRREPERGAPAAAASAAPPAKVSTSGASGPVPDAVRALLSRMRETVERHCDYVGPAFADEARRMHRGDRDARAIYGEATDAERESLADEGVEVTRIPWLPRADS